MKNDTSNPHALQPQFVRNSVNSTDFRILPTREPLAVVAVGYPPAPCETRVVFRVNANPPIPFITQHKPVEFVRLPAKVRCELERAGWTFVSVGGAE